MRRPGQTRRRFLASLAAGAGMLACGMPWRARAPARLGKRSPLRLVFYTDVHARTEWETPRALERAAEAINAQRPDLVIAGGDLITDGFQSSAATVEPRWETYLRMHEAIRAPLYPVLGNHDFVAAVPEDGTAPSQDPRAPFREKLGLEETYRAFDAGGYHFIILDSVQVTADEFKYQGLIPPDQLEWLRQDLGRIPATRPVVLVTHIPLLTGFFQATRGATEAAPRNRVIMNSREVLETFRERRLLLVLQGHLHVDEMLRWSGTTFITGGAVCAKYWRGAWHGTEEGFGVVTLDGERVGWEYVDYGWEAHRPAGL